MEHPGPDVAVLYLREYLSDDGLADVEITATGRASYLVSARGATFEIPAPSEGADLLRWALQAAGEVRAGLA